MIGLIIAAGKGERLRPLSSSRSKSMLPILDKPLLEHVIVRLATCGISRIVVCVNYQKEKIMKHFGDGSQFGTVIRYVCTQQDIGSWATILEGYKHIQGETVVVWTGDIFASLNPSEIVQFHEKTGSMATIAVCQTDSTQFKGEVSLDDRNVVSSYEEKLCPAGTLINAGIYVLEPAFIRNLPKLDSPLSERELFPLLVKRGLLLGFRFNGYYVNVNEPRDYLKANFIALEGLQKGQIPYIVRKNEVTVSENVEIVEPVFIASGCKIEDGCTIGPYVCVGAKSHLESECRLEHSVLLPHVKVGGRSILKEAIVDEGTFIKRGSVVKSKIISKDAS